MTEERGWLPAGTTQGDLADGDFAWLSDAYKAGKESATDGRKLPYKIHGKVNEAGWRAAWTRVHQMSAGDFAGGPSQQAVMEKLMRDKPADVTVGAPMQHSSSEKYEVRIASELWPDADFEIRATEGGDGMTFTGYAAVFNSPSEPIYTPRGTFVETIRPGAFTRTLKHGGDVRMFWNHNTDIPLGSTRAKSMSLTETDRGLLAEARLPNTTHGRDAAELIQSGIVRSMSFGFTVPKGGDTWSEDYGQRELKQVALREVSPISGWPAYPATTATVRHLAEVTEEDPESLAEAFRLLSASEEPLTDEHFNLLLRVLNTRRGERELTLAPKLSYWRERLAQLPQ